MQCTWHALIGKGGQEEFNRNPRKVWYYNLQEVTTNGDFEATFHLGHPQPSFLMLLASGFSPVYPCHVSQRDMRTKPVGTGPFKFVELQRNVGIKFVRNPDYWKKGKPYVDAIEMRIIESRSTRILAFVSGEFDMTFDRDVTVPLMKDVKAQAPQAVCQLGPTNVSTNLAVNSAAPPFDNPQIRKAMALALDRKAFIDILTEGKAKTGAAMLPAPEGQWAVPPEELAQLPGYGVRHRREPGRGAEDHGRARLRAGQAPEGEGVGPQHLDLSRPRGDPDRPAQEDPHPGRAGGRSTPRCGTPRCSAATIRSAST